MYMKALIQAIKHCLTGWWCKLHHWITVNLNWIDNISPYLL